MVVERRADAEISKRIESSLLTLVKKVDDNHSAGMKEIGKINVTVAEIKIHQENCQKEIDSCFMYRTNNEAEKKETQSTLTTVEEKQKGTHRMLGFLGLGMVGVATRVIYKFFDKQ